ncbi:hypothetical protein [Noviherbaspirillum sedimenti]|nr:hypothetical protein [Noviherbaspirillum sedimenti]
MTEQDMALLGIDAASVLLVYSWGFGAVLSAWATGYGLGAAIDLIRKL